MTVSYYPRIATVKKGVLFRLLLRWKGSLYKLVLPEILVFIILYTTLSSIYRFALNDGQRRTFEGICLYLHQYGNSTSITFSLGFFVSFVMNRWWETFRTMPWLYTPAFVIRQIIQPPLNRFESACSAKPSSKARHNSNAEAQSGVTEKYASPINQQVNHVDTTGTNQLPNNGAIPRLVPNLSAQTDSTNVLINAQQTTAVSNLPEVRDSDGSSVNVDTMKHKSPEAAKTPNGHIITGAGVDNANLMAAPEQAAGAECRRKVYEETLGVRLTLMRYLLLGWIFAIRRISTPVMVRFKPTDKLADATLRQKLTVLNADPFIQRYVNPLITEQEIEAVIAYARLILGDNADSYEPDHYIPMSWAADLVHDAWQRGFITSRHLVRELLETFKEFRGGLGMLRFMDQFNIPLVYTQVVALSMYIYFIIVCFAQQFLDPNARNAAALTVFNATHGSNSTSGDAIVVSIDNSHTEDSREVTFDLFIPIPSVLYLMFLLGWLRVAEVCLNPFGEDDDDFPTWQILNMNVETAYKMMNVFELERVYDGSIMPERRLRKDSLSRSTSAFIGATTNPIGTSRVQQTNQSRRSSASTAYLHDRDVESNSKSSASDKFNPNDFSHQVNDVFRALDDSNDRANGLNSNTEGSEALSCYFDEQLESIRRVNYEHLRKKYEKPFFQGGAIETEMQENPSTLRQSTADLVQANTDSHMPSRAGTFARQLGSMLHLPGMAQHSSRLAVNARADGHDESPTRLLPPVPPISVWYANGSHCGHGSQSRLGSASSVAGAQPASKPGEEPAPVRLYKKQPAIANKYLLSPNSEKRAFMRQNGRLPSPLAVPAGTESNPNLGGPRCNSQFEIRQVGISLSDEDSPLRIGRSATSSNNLMEKNEAQQQSLSGSQCNLKKIVETENDAESVALRKSQTDGYADSDSTTKLLGEFNPTRRNTRTEIMHIQTSAPNIFLETDSEPV